jgi:hypothetical protein
VRLSLRSLIIAGALFNAICFLVVALLNLLLPPFGGKYLELLTTFYIGYHPETGPLSIVIGVLYAIIAGALEGALFGLLYNAFVEKS